MISEGCGKSRRHKGVSAFLSASSFVTPDDGAAGDPGPTRLQSGSGQQCPLGRCPTRSRRFGKRTCEWVPDLRVAQSGMTATGVAPP